MVEAEVSGKLDTCNHTVSNHTTNRKQLVYHGHWSLGVTERQSIQQAD